MCTALSYYTKNNNFFGRNLDLDFSYNETVTIAPRGYDFKFRHAIGVDNPYAIIGMAYVVEDYPLYYDAMNEVGLAVAGLNFPDNAYYEAHTENGYDIASFEVIPWILTQCCTVEEVKVILEDVNIVDTSFNVDLSPAPLHWMVADGEKSIVIEQTKSGLHIYDNPVGVMTNNPTFDIQLFNLNNYLKVSKEQADDKFAESIDLNTYSRGMGGIGLPGDLSSMSRFVKATFTKLNSISDGTELDDISQFFHILKSVEQQRGCVHIQDDRYEITIYSSCCNLDRGIYYYTTYNNPQITAVNMWDEDLDNDKLISYLLKDKMNIDYVK